MCVCVSFDIHIWNNNHIVSIHTVKVTFWCIMFRFNFIEHQSVVKDWGLKFRCRMYIIDFLILTCLFRNKSYNTNLKVVYTNWKKKKQQKNNKENRIHISVCYSYIKFKWKHEFACFHWCKCYWITDINFFKYIVFDWK